MIQKITQKEKYGNSHISILYPGIVMNGMDTGLGTIGRIDHAQIGAGVTFKMHPHVNDVILSYFRTGKARHTDSGGYEEFIGGSTFMLMKAGRVFYHKEEIIKDLEGLWIVLRPKTKDSEPSVEFAELMETQSINTWRLIASPGRESSFQLSPETWISEMYLTEYEQRGLPPSPPKDLTGILYVIEGILSVNEHITLLKGESLLFKDEDLILQTNDTAQLVLFLTDE